MARMKPANTLSTTGIRYWRGTGISLAGDGIHFVEVKSRTAPVQGEPQEAVTASKQRHIAAAAGKYMSMKQKYLGRDLEVWFDVAAITYDGAQVEFRYFPAAYVPIYL